MAAGMFNLVTLVITHHLILVILFNNFDAMFLLMFTLSFSWIWGVAYLDDITEESVYYKILYNEIF